MAKVQEEIYTIKLSKLLKDEVKEPEDIASDRLASSVESLIQQMVEPGVVVEVTKD